MITPLLGLVTGYLISLAIRAASVGDTSWLLHAACAVVVAVAIGLYFQEKYGGRHDRR